MSRSLRPTEWIAAFLAGAAVVYLAAYFPLVAAPRFRVLMHEFGAPLPLFTRIAISRWFAPSLALPPAAALALAIMRKRPLLIAAAFLLGVSAVAACMYGLYLPILEMAGKIRAE